MRKLKLRKTLSLALCMVMLVGMFPVSAFATEEAPAEPPAQIEQQPSAEPVVPEPPAEQPQQPVVPDASAEPASDAPTEQPGSDEPAPEQPAADTPTEGNTPTEGDTPGDVDICQHSGGSATCTEAGVCSACGEAYIEATGHSGGEATCTELAICSTCGETYGELASHNFTEGACSACGEAKPTEQPVKRTIKAAPAKAAAADLSTLTRPGSITLVYSGQPQTIWTTPTPSDGTFFWSYNVNDGGFTPLPKNYTDIGQYDVSWYLLDGDNNIVDSGSFTSYIIPPMSAPPILGENLVYNGQPQLLATAAEGSEVSLDGEVWSATVSATNAGTHAVHYRTTINGISSEVGKELVTIARKSISQVQYSTSKFFDGTDTLTLSIPLGEDSGVVEGDDVTVTLNFSFPSANVEYHQNGVELTSYALKGQHSGNYTASLNTSYSFPGNIKKLPITVQADEIFTRYSDPDPDLTYSVTSEHAEDINAVLELCPLEGKLEREQGDELNYPYEINQGTLTNENNPNYDITYISSTLTQLKKPITISGVVGMDKVYDGTTGTKVSYENAFTNDLPEDYDFIVNLTEGDAHFISTDAGYNIQVSPAQYDFSIKTPAGEVVTRNFEISFDLPTADITPASVSVSGISTKDKEYDGSTAAQFNFRNAHFSGLPTGYEATITSLSGSFADKNAGDNKSVSINGYDISIADAKGNSVSSANFSFTFPDDLTAYIKPCVIIPGKAEGLEKVYDGTAKSTNLIIYPDNAVEGEDVSLSFDAVYKKNGEEVADVGSGYEILASNFALEGADKGNYSLAPLTGMLFNNGSITPREITVKANDKIITYGDAAPEYTYAITEGSLVESDELGLSLSCDYKQFDDVGSYDITIDTSKLNPNYTVSTEAGQLTVKVKAAYITGLSVKNKVYDGTVTADYEADNLEIQGLVNGDQFTVTVDSVKFESAEVSENAVVLAPFTVTPVGSADKENYVWFIDIPTVSISPAPLTVSGTGTASGTYGTKLSELTINGLTAKHGQTEVPGTWKIDGDTVPEVGSGTYTAKFTPNSDADNYEELTAEVTVTIEKRPVTITGASSTKVYNGGTFATINLNSASITGLPEGYTASLPDSVSGILDDAIPPVQHFVSFDSSGIKILYGQTDVTGYFDISLDSEFKCNIIPCTVKLSGISVQEKNYDGTVDAQCNYSNVTAEGLLSGCKIEVTSLTLEFGVADAGTHPMKLVDISYTITDGGSGNFKYTTDHYTVVLDESITGTINPLPVVVTPVEGQSKTYGSDDPTLSFTTDKNGSFGVLTLSRAEGKDVGKYDYSLDTSKASTNYSFSLASDADKFVINPLELTDSNLQLKVSNKSYTGSELCGVDSIENLTATEMTADSYTISGDTATALGSYTVKLEGKGNYSGSVEAQWKVTAPDIIEAVTDGTVTVDNATLDQLDELRLLEEALATVSDNTVASEDEKAQWAEAAEKLPAIIDALEALEQLINSEDIKAAENINEDNVSVDDKEKLEAAEAAIVKLLDDYAGTLDAETTAELQGKLDTIEKSLKALESAERIIAEIEKWLKDNKEKFDADELKLREEYQDIKDDMDALSENSQRIVKNTVGKALDAAKAKLYTYKITTGDRSNWAKGSGATLDFTANGHTGLFYHLLIDGKTLDTKNYTVASGSTIVKLKANYLQNLSTGKHTIQFVYDDGKTDIGSFNVVYAWGSPRTSDDSNIGLWMCLMFMSAAAIVVALPRIKPRKDNN